MTPSTTTPAPGGVRKVTSLADPATATPSASSTRIAAMTSLRFADVSTDRIIGRGIKWPNFISVKVEWHEQDIKKICSK